VSRFHDCPGRRAVLKAGFGWGIHASLANAAESAASMRPKEGDLLVKVEDAKAVPLTPDDIPLASEQIAAWAMDPGDRTIRNGDRLNRILVLRFPPEKLTLETQARSAEGVVAYTAICTHAGCEVSDWISDKQQLFCPCHDSTFDPKDTGRVIDGPAQRMLPALPLKVVEKKLVIAKPFTERIYFDKS
jgi:rieske iron-sulfur protein